jgi:hypothetical protein
MEALFASLHKGKVDKVPRFEKSSLYRIYIVNVPGH